MSKLRGRAVLFNYMLELDAADVRVLLAALKAVQTYDQAMSFTVQVAVPVPDDKTREVIGQLKEQLDTALQQLVATKRFFTEGTTEAGRQMPRRGIDIPVVQSAEEIPVSE